ncbi:DUF4148 domain-containing protein [Paraburkholderia sp. CI3]|uniref:DUF4148 domain-containing protein n=1 Tax=Paraburkholderia sp. CI3 TaxID=2991060 RepID=UPI003D1A72CC
MKMKFAMGVSLIVLASAGVVTNASAQEKTRAEVRQELIEAENNGSRLVTDASYPEVSPIFAQQAAQLQQRHESGTGSSMSGTSAMGTGVAGNAGGTQPACVGPMGFCTPYFGS